MPNVSLKVNCCALQQKAGQDYFPCTINVTDRGLAIVNFKPFCRSDRLKITILIQVQKYIFQQLQHLYNENYWFSKQQMQSGTTSHPHEKFIPISFLLQAVDHSKSMIIIYLNMSKYQFHQYTQSIQSVRLLHIKTVNNRVDCFCLDGLLILAGQWGWDFFYHH